MLFSARSCKEWVVSARRSRRVLLNELWYEACPLRSRAFKPSGRYPRRRKHSSVGNRSERGGAMLELSKTRLVHRRKSTRSAGILSQKTLYLEATDHASAARYATIVLVAFRKLDIGEIEEHVSNSHWVATGILGCFPYACPPFSEEYKETSYPDRYLLEERLDQCCTIGERSYQ